MAPPACPPPPPPPADGGAAAIASARTSCVCGLFVPVKVHLSIPCSSGGTRSNAATCASTPEAKTTFPSGDAASARTSARCCLCELSCVACCASQKVTSPSLLPLTRVPSGRYWSAHTHRSSDSVGLSPAPTVMRASSVSESQSKTWMAPLLEPAAMVEPSAVQARERSRPATRLKLRRWARPEPTPSPATRVSNRTHPSSQATATRWGAPRRGEGSEDMAQTEPPWESVAPRGRRVLRSHSVIWPSRPAERRRQAADSAPPPLPPSASSASAKGAHHVRDDTAAPSRPGTRAVHRQSAVS